MRSNDAVPRWNRFTTQPSATTGQFSMPRYTVNATNSPSVMLPAITSRPPRYSAISAATPDRNASAGWKIPETRISSELRRA